jgi:hypothetical protein
VAGAFLTGMTAVARFALPGGQALELAALAAATVMALGATPVISGLVRPLPTISLTAQGVRLSATRLIRWRDIETAEISTAVINHIAIRLKPSPRDPNGPQQRVRARIPAVIEPWVREAAVEMIARRLAD